MQDDGWLNSWCSQYELVEWDLLVSRVAGAVDFVELLQHAEQGGYHEARHLNRFLSGLAWRGTSSRQPAKVRRHYLCNVFSIRGTTNFQPSVRSLRATPDTFRETGISNEFMEAAQTLIIAA